MCPVRTKNAKSKTRNSNEWIIIIGSFSMFSSSTLFYIFFWKNVAKIKYNLHHFSRLSHWIVSFRFFFSHFTLLKKYTIFFFDSLHLNCEFCCCLSLFDICRTNIQTTNLNIFFSNFENIARILRIHIHTTKCIDQHPNINISARIIFEKNLLEYFRCWQIWIFYPCPTWIVNFIIKWF